MEKVQIVWFKRDLRIADHRPLAAAAARGPVLPLYVVEPEWWRQPDMSARQWAFARECLEELDQDLTALGQGLVVRTGRVTEVLTALADELPVAGLWSHEETGNGWTYARNREVAVWCKAKGLGWQELPQHGIVRGLKDRDGWAKRWDKFMAEPLTAPPMLKPVAIDVGQIPALPDSSLAGDACPERQRGGRRAAEERLESFLHQRGRDYRQAMSSPLSGADACSRLSPHFAWGSLSLREASQATWERQRELKAENDRSGWRPSLKSFNGRLHWHCHFMQKLEDEPRLEHENLHRAYDGARPLTPDRERLEAWCKGETGLPFVDACMRSLDATGWLNFRMRAMLMAVASYHLWLDWRAPGQHLARLFTDYEPGIHWPQVQMQSGTTGINSVRIYNPVKQGYDQDPDGVFVRRWLPELEAVPDEFLQEPWRWNGAGAVLDRHYPMPIIDHLQAAKDARQKVWAVRGGKEFCEAASAIQSRHGSRKRSTRPRRAKSKTAADAGKQETLL